MKIMKRRRSPPPSVGTAPSPSRAKVFAVRDAASVPAVVASLFTRIRIAQRARVLRRLLLPVGPLALAVVGGGAFAKFTRQARWARMPISLQDAARITSAQVFELVRYVEQSNPAMLRRVFAVLARDAATMAAIGASFTTPMFPGAARSPR